MYRHLKRLLVLLLALIAFIIGFLGIVLPLLPGIVFIAIGLLLLSLYFPSLREFISRHTVRFPKLHQAIAEVELWIEKIIGRP